VSLILEALKKLERDRHTHDRGFLVLAPSAFSPSGDHTRMRGALLLGVAALAGAAAAVLLLQPGRAPQIAAPEAAPAGAPSPPPVTMAAAAPVTTAPAPVAQPSPVAAGPRVAWRWQGRNAAGKPADPAPAAPVRTEPPAAGSAAAAPSETPATEPAEVEPAEPAPEPEEGVAAEAAADPAATPEEAPLRLQAIAERDGQPVAVVNGQVVRVGDRIGASTVVRIGAAEIELDTGGLRRILRF
jgi:hypothetical protein